MGGLGGGGQDGGLSQRRQYSAGGWSGTWSEKPRCNDPRWRNALVANQKGLGEPGPPVLSWQAAWGYSRPRYCARELELELTQSHMTQSQCCGVSDGMWPIPTKYMQIAFRLQLGFGNPLGSGFASHSEFSFQVTRFLLIPSDQNPIFNQFPNPLLKPAE